MQIRTLARLGALVAVLGGLAVAVKQWPVASDAQTLPRLWPETLLQEMDRLHIRDATGQEIRIEKVGEQWLLRNRLDQPVSASSLRALADALRLAKVVEAKTAQAGQHAKLGIAEQSPEMRRLTMVAGEKVLAELLLGKTASSGGGQFVRLAGQAQVWQLDRPLKAGADARDWLQTELVDWPAGRVRRVERVQDANIRCVTTPCPRQWQVLFSLSKPEAASEWTLTPIPAGRQALAGWQLSSLAEALAGLQLDDLKSAEGVDLSAALTTRFQRDDGLLLYVSTVEQGGQTWLALLAEAPEAQEALQKEATDLNARWQGKLYQVASYKGEAFRKNLESLTEAAAKPAATKLDSEKPAVPPNPNKKP